MIKSRLYRKVLFTKLNTNWKIRGIAAPGADTTPHDSTIFELLVSSGEMSALVAINKSKFSSLTQNSPQSCEHHSTEEIRIDREVPVQKQKARTDGAVKEEGNMALLDLSTEQALHRADTEKTGEALYDLGILFSTGQGVDMDYVEAHKWFNLAALRGVIEARDWRAEIAREMSMDQIAEAQRQAREWLAGH